MALISLMLETGVKSITPLQGSYRMVVWDKNIFSMMSAELGDVEGMWNLGWRYLLGEGIKPSTADAVQWWSRADALGHPKARNMINRI
jgi:TPR repeat protein